MTIALTEHELQFALRHLDQLNPAQKTQVLQLLEERERLAKYEDARQHFLSFVKMVWPDFIPGAHHQIMAEAFEDVAAGKCNRLIINLPPRHCLALDTPLLTPTGWTTMGEVQPGDYVYGADGKPTQVVGKSEVHVGRACYRVTAKDGTSVVTDGGHLWRAAIDRKRPGIFKLRTTEQLFQREQGTAEHRKAWIPDSPPVVFEPGAPLPVGPYTLGMWIGNGHASQAIITNDSRDLAPVRAVIESEGYTTTDQATRLTFGILGLKVKLRDLGVLDNKHIPDAYMRASVEDRLRLLYGLFDSDGCCSREGQCDISTSDPHLRDQYEELLRSVGIHPHVYEFDAKIGDKSYGPAWRLYFYVKDFGLAPRKRARTRANTKPVRRYISVARHKSVPVQCIEVDRPDGLFLAGRGLLVTHNTKSELASWLLPAWFLGKFPRKKIIQASNTEALAAGFGRRVRNLIDGEDMSDGSDDVARSGFSAYQNIFPNVRLAADSKAAAGWHTNKGGEYFAIGVNGKVTGKGGDIVIIDDPHALATDTEIPTPQGFRMLKDLQVGDMVFGPDGEPTRVVAKSPVYEGRELYRVTTNDGASVYADAAHLWNYRSDTKVTAPFVTGRTDELSRWKKVSAPVLPTVSPVRYVQRKLPIDPYLLGVWLGNGTATLGRITSHLDDVAWFREQFDCGGYETTDQADPHNFGVIGLRAELIAAGLFDNKHIPEGYLSASYEQRLALLQGLMDTDGHVMNSGTCNFDNTNASLVEGVCELVRSFGVRAIIKHFHKADGAKSDCYRVNFSLPEACRLPRKRAKLKSVYTKRGRSITVTPTGVHGRVQCITVERPDGLFLAGRGYIVTHNSEQEAKQAESNPAIFDDVYAWYNSGPRQRLQPGGTIILVMCMTGDTPVMRPDGTETPLSDIRAGDEVATYENGRITTARVTNFQSNGVDEVFTVQTRSGRLFRANARHPFLVDMGGERQWVPLAKLQPGMQLVSTTVATDLRGRKSIPVSAPLVSRKSLTTKSTPTPLTGRSVFMENGKENCASAVQKPLRKVAGYATHAIKKSIRPDREHLLKKGRRVLNLATGLLKSNTRSWWLNAATGVMYAGNHPTKLTHERIGTANFASTTITPLKKFAGFFATIVTSRLATEKRQKLLNAPPCIFGVTTDEVVSVAPSGREEVFDVEIERTENFIANGIVSHNTRWSKRDLTGKVLAKQAAEKDNPDTDKWRVISFPALLDENTPEERPTWPGFWPLPTLRATRSVLPVSSWSAQYQQNPTSEGAAILKREYWRRWGDDDKEKCPGPQHIAAWQNGDPPACEYIIGSWDCAATANERSHPSAYTLWGVFKAEDPTSGKTLNHIILLQAYKARMEFPELKRTAKQFYDEDRPDTLLIENKSAGMQLLQEFRSMGIPAEGFTGSSRGSRALSNDKIARANMIADVFASRYVWCPPTRFADEVMEQCASFPAGEEDDLVDSTVQAMLRFREGGFVRTANDEAEDSAPPRFRRKRYY